MRPQKLSRFLSILFLLPLVLYADTELANEEEPVPQNIVSDEMLIKPSFLDFDDLDMDDSLSDADTEVSEDPGLSVSPDFFTNLQASAGLSAPMMSQMTAGGDSAHTWIPKFVWIGDIKSSDELKCFAAFLIGSLENNDGSGAQQAASPGVFMTPYTTTPANAQASAPPQNYIQQPPPQNYVQQQQNYTQQQQNYAQQQQNYNQQNYVQQPPQNLAQRLADQQAQAPIPQVAPEQLIARRSENSTPPPMPANSRIYTEFQAGAGFPLFSGVSANFTPTPVNAFKEINALNNATTDAAGNPIIPNYSIRGRIEKNVSLLLTADIGYRISNYINFAATFMAQQGLFLRTKPFQNAYLKNAAGGSDGAVSTTNFQSNLDLYSIGGKLLLNWHNMLKFRSWTMSLFAGGSAACSWQSWTNVTAVQTYYNDPTSTAPDTMTSANISFRSKYFVNFSYTGDGGLLFKPTNIFAKTSLRLGCKFIGWGAARGLGAFKDQADIFRTASGSPGDPDFPPGGPPVRFSYFKPLIIKYVYSFAPYIGFKWEF